VEVEATPPRRLWALIKHLPPDAALWRDIREHPETPQEKYGSNVVSIDDFVAKNKSAVSDAA
jgi:hypothetical protein